MSREFLFKEDPGTQLFCMPLAGQRVMLKRYLYSGIFLQLRARFFQSRARREHQVLISLRDRGIACLDPIAFGEIDSGPLRLSSYLISRFQENSVTLEARLDEWPERKIRNQVLSSVARLVAESHQKGFLHGTLFPRNILLDRKGEDPPRLFDAPFGRFLGRPLTVSERAQDLSCLLRFSHPWIIAGEKARFLRIYLGRGPDEKWGKEGRQLAQACLGSSAFTRSLRRKLVFHWRRWRGLPHLQAPAPPRPH